MKRLEVSSKRLNNGDIAVEMSYNQQNRTKKIIFFFIIAVIVGAIAFSACFFALEISRTNAYNNRLNNSIVEPTQETPPETIEPSLPDDNNSTTDNNEPGGSASDEGETGLDKLEDYSVIIQCVWGISSTPYSLQKGVEEAKNHLEDFYLDISANGTTSEQVSYLSFYNPKACYDFASPNQNDGLEAGIALAERSYKIGVKRLRGINLKVIMNFSSSFSDYTIDFAELFEDGSLRGLEGITIESTTARSFTLSATECQDQTSTRYIYAYITQKVNLTIVDSYEKNYPVKVWNCTNASYAPTTFASSNYWVYSESIFNTLHGWSSGPKLLDCLIDSKLYIKYEKDIVANVEISGRLYNCFTVWHIDELFNINENETHTLFLYQNKDLTFNNNLNFPVSIECQEGISPSITFNGELEQDLNIYGNLSKCYVNNGCSGNVYQDDVSTLNNLYLKDIKGYIDLNGKVTGDMLPAGWPQLATFVNCSLIYLNEEFNTVFECSIELYNSVALLRSGTYKDIHVNEKSTLKIQEEGTPDEKIKMGKIYTSASGKIIISKNLPDQTLDIVKESGLNEKCNNSSYEGFVEIESNVLSQINISIQGTLLSGTYNIVKFNGSTTSNIKISTEQKFDPVIASPYYKIIINGTYEINSYYGETNSIEWLASLTTYTPGNTYYLTQNITIPKSANFKGIGINASNNEFTGIFDGCGYTIYFEEVVAEEDNFGLFKKIRESTIKNLTVDGSILVNASIENVGAICGYAVTNTGMKSSIINCVNKANIINSVKYQSVKNVGGICGYLLMGTNISNCVNYGIIEGPSNVGGICGRFFAGYGSETIENCVNYGIIEGPSYVGGICGNGYGNIENCVNYGSVSGGNSVAGICGANLSISKRFANCYNFGLIKGTGSGVGGILGSNDVTAANNGKTTIKNCHSIGDVYVKSTYKNIGGICGNGSVENCVFKGNIYCDDGGVLSPENVSLATNDGNVKNFMFIGNIISYNTPDGDIIGTVADGETAGFYFTKGTTARAVERCFVVADKTKIMSTPTGSLSTYTNCSTFKDIHTSLVYNGSVFGYVAEALSDPDNNVFWSLNEEGGYPVIDKTKTTLTTVLTITEIDNLNAINNMVIDNNIVYNFDYHSLYFINDFSLKNFDGLGDDAHPIEGGLWHGNQIYIYGNPIFNTVKNATVRNFVINPGMGCDGKVTINYYTFAKEIVNCSFENCVNNANLISDEISQYLGGLVYCATNSSFTSCVNNGNITGGESQIYIGGIVGKGVDLILTTCSNYGNINSPVDDGIIGGIVGEATVGLTLTKCSNYGDILNGGSVGGIVGLLLSASGNYTINNCYSNCKILSKTNAGGVVGMTAGTVNITNCITQGIISSTGESGDARMGGIVGYSTASSLNITNCVSFAVIDNKINRSTTAGIAYVASGTCNINNSYFFGDFISSNYSVIASGTATVNNCGYNINNKELTNDNLATLIYVKEDNPVWSSSAYIKMLFKTETESMLNGTNTKLELNWYDTDTATTGIQSGYDTTFWSSVFVE